MKSWAVRAADENVVAKIPDRGLTCGRIVEHIVRVAVAVKVGCTCQAPAAADSRPGSASNKRSPRQIPDRGLARAVLKHIIRMAVAIKISYSHHTPAHRKCWSVTSANVHIVAKIPDRGLTCGALHDPIASVAVAIKVGCTCQAPATGNARPMSSSNKRWPR